MQLAKDATTNNLLIKKALIMAQGGITYLSMTAAEAGMSIHVISSDSCTIRRGKGGALVWTVGRHMEPCGQGSLKGVGIIRDIINQVATCA